MICNFPHSLLTAASRKSKASSGSNFNGRFLFQNEFNLAYGYQYQNSGNTRAPLSVLVKTHLLKVGVLFG